MKHIPNKRIFKKWFKKCWNEAETGTWAALHLYSLLIRRGYMHSTDPARPTWSMRKRERKLCDSWAHLLPTSD